MRNLKRALSLALASVMLMGMMVVGTSAASYKDADAIENDVAVEVLNATGVMIGDDKGNFNPDQIVTRAEMATIVCKILYGEKLNVKHFADAKVFTDVPDWAKGYVNLAASLGIVEGRGNGIFDPNAPVTTAEATLMLSKALGYFQNAKEYADDWALAAVTRGTQLDLFGDLVLATNEGLTRDNVAVLTFNALTQCVPVDYNETFDTYYNAGQSWIAGVYYNAYETLGYKNFDLVSLKDTDSFGRPGKTWGIGTYTVDSNNEIVSVDMDDEIITEVNKPIATYTASQTSTAKANAVKKALKSYSIQTAAGVNQTEVVTNGNSAVAAGSIEADIINKTANGVTVEVYAGAGDENSAKIITDIVVIMPEKAEVLAVNTVKNTVTLALDKTGGIMTIEDDSDFYNVVKDLEVEDVVGVVAKDSANALDVFVPEAISGKITQVKVNTNDDLIAVMDGTKYTVSARAANDFGADLNKTGVIYLDQNGYVLYIDTTSYSVPNYLYVTNVWEEKVVEYGKPATDVFVRGVNALGEVVTLQIANNDGIVGDGAVVDSETFGTLTYTAYPNVASETGEAYIFGNKQADGEFQTYYYNGVLTNLVNAGVGTMMQYKKSAVDSDLYVLVVAETGNTSPVVDGVVNYTGTEIKDTDKKLGAAYLSTGVKFVFVNYNAANDKLTATVEEKVCDVAAATAKFLAVDTNTDTNEQLITTVFVADRYINDESIYYVDGSASYEIKYTDANGNLRTGYIADLYLNGVVVADAILYNDYGTGFYRLDKMDGDAYKLSDATADYGTEVKAITDLYNNNMTVVGGAEYDVTETAVVDLTGDYAGITMAGIKSLLNSDYCVKVSVQFKTVNSKAVATIVYVADVVDPDSTSISATGYKFYATAEKAAAAAKEVAASTVINIAPVTANIGATILDADHGCWAWVSGATLADNAVTMGTTTVDPNVGGITMVAFTVKAADGVTVDTYYTAFETIA